MSYTLQDLQTVVGHRLKKIRTDRKESARHVTGQIHMCPKTLRKIENGQSIWLVETFGRLCEYYKVAPGDLFEGF
jgi:DNA-binding Xre family transcriptional regulator